MKLSSSSTNFKSKKISFNGIINSEYFFHRSGPIKLALNQDRIIKNNYYIKKAHKKIDQGRKLKRVESREDEDLDLSQEYRRNKTRIPADLNKVILKYDKKFQIQNQKFHDNKDDNDKFLSYWHYVNDLSEKKERELMLKKFFNDKDKNSINYHMKEVKNMCENMFKTSPLLSGNRYLDIFFYYLSEFDKNYENKKKMLYIKQKALKFLEKIKDLVDFVEVIQDTGLDAITKDVRIKHSKYRTEYERKVKLELKKNVIKQRKQDIKDIKLLDKMNKKTTKTLLCMEKNKNIFEDENFPLDINSKIEKSRNFISSNISPYSTQSRFHVFTGNKNSKMNNTASTAFYLSGKGFFTNKNNKKFFSGLNNDINKEEEILKSAIQNYKFKFERKRPSLISLKKNYSDIREKKEKSETIRSLKEQKLSIKNRFNFIHLTQRKPNLISSIDKMKDVNPNFSSSKRLSISKKVKLNTQSQFSNLNENSTNKIETISKENNQIINKKSLGSNKSLNDINEKSIIKNEDNSNINLKKIKKIINKKKSRLSVLYNEIKKQKKIKDSNKKNVKNYFVKKKKIENQLNLSNSVYIMDMIKKAKNIIDGIDIEQRTKKVFQTHLSHEQLKKLDSIKEINKRVRGLDIQFVKDIINYKSNKNN